MKDHITRAFKSVAHRLHDQIDHKRKYTGDPYTTHLDAVESGVAQSPLQGTDMVIARCAAFGHDLFEDVFPVLYPSTNYLEVLERLIIDELGGKVSDEDSQIISDTIYVIVELTDVYTTENFPQLNRAARKQLEAERYATVSSIAKTVKQYDIADNTASIMEHDNKFVEVYLKEKREMLKQMSVYAGIN